MTQFGRQVGLVEGRSARAVAMPLGADSHATSPWKPASPWPLTPAALADVGAAASQCLALQTLSHANMARHVACMQLVILELLEAG